MSDDLVERLRAEGIAELDEAADHIEKLETALREIVAWPTTVKAKMVKIARKALDAE